MSKHRENDKNQIKEANMAEKNDSLFMVTETEGEFPVTDESVRIPKYARKMHPKKSKKVRNALEGNDIRYRGPLSYRHLRIIVWVLMAVSICGSILGFVLGVFPGAPEFAFAAETIMELVGRLSVPLFLLANFSLILHVRNGYKRLLISYGFFSIVLILLFLLIFDHYFNGVVHLIIDDQAAAQAFVDTTMIMIFKDGFLAFNVFIDLFMFTLLSFFLSYNPKRFFKGKKHVIFRLMALLPVLYEIASFVLKYLAVTGRAAIPVHIWPLLTTKPPIVFLVFIVLALHFKNKERSFRKSGFTHHEYREYMNTNRNSLNFSVFAAVSFVIAGIVDLLLFVVIPLLLMGVMADIANPDRFNEFIHVAQTLGLGQGVYFFILAPFVLLFSYTKSYKNKTMDIFIPIGGFIFIVLAVFEFVFQLAKIAPSVM